MTCGAFSSAKVNDLRMLRSSQEKDKRVIASGLSFKTVQWMLGAAMFRTGLDMCG